MQQGEKEKTCSSSSTTATLLKISHPMMRYVRIKTDPDGAAYDTAASVL
jgi:hypothetical protein